MKSSARPELPTVMDCSTPTSTRPGSTYKSGKVVQTNGATSNVVVEALDNKWDYGSIKLLVDNFEQNNFGDTHTLRELAMPYTPIFDGKSEALRLNNTVYWERTLEITEA